MDIKAQAERAEKLRKLHHGPRILALPNAWDVVSARILEEVGHPAIATSTRPWRSRWDIPMDSAFLAVRCWTLWQGLRGQCKFRSLPTWSQGTEKLPKRLLTSREQ